MPNKLTTLEAILQDLSAEDRDTTASMLGVIIGTLQHGKGVAILLADPRGDGHATLISAGNEMMTPVLLAAGGRMSEKLYGRTEMDVVQ